MIHIKILDITWNRLVCLQAAEHLDDEDDVEDEETALENFTTAVDNEETDEYIAFRTSLQGNDDLLLFQQLPNVSGQTGLHCQSLSRFP